jgi:N6-L-threonylcarbamoyladenine synthase
MERRLILGVESSCDETALAIVDQGRYVLSNCVASQAHLHRKYGGVVPEVAARNHLQWFPILLKETLAKAQVGFEDLAGIAVTSEPGLIGALLIGLSLAKGLAFRLQIPFLTVNHLEAHLYAAELNEAPIEFPALGMVISGGHTEVYWIEHWGKCQLLIETRDDAAGEAFDKVAKLLGLPYPGGPEIDRLALQAEPRQDLFPVSKMKDGSLDFSFSGLKTAALLEIQKYQPLLETHKHRIALKFQLTVIEQIKHRLLEMMRTYHPTTVIVGGGVAGNLALRSMLQMEVEQKMNIRLRIPVREYCSDNAAMIAGLGTYYFTRGKHSSWNASAFPVDRIRREVIKK